MSYFPWMISVNVYCYPFESSCCWLLSLSSALSSFSSILYMLVGIYFLSAMLNILERKTYKLSSNTPKGSLFRNLTDSWQSVMRPIFMKILTLTLVVSILSNILLFSLNKRYLWAILHYLSLLFTDGLSLFLLSPGCRLFFPFFFVVNNLFCFILWYLFFSG